MTEDKRGRFDPPPDGEPLFTAIRRTDPEMRAAYAQAAASLDVFRAHLARSGDRFCSAKLRFRDPDLSEATGEDRFLYLWLTSVHYHEKENLFSGTFFEVPVEFQKWHQVGERLGFEGDDIFDWMVNDEGHIHGGFTLRVARKNLPAAEQPEFDRFVGAEVWEPLP